ncbi:MULTISPECIES: RHS repeat-associated core domain-containing protein [Prevotella]|uniref:RHS repeat-associated core domain-containing protein n=1 Tax=Prevotella TaxID=838 RepID=UPI0026D966AF
MLYPENLFNRVIYTYGKAGDKYNRAGRLALVEDASGGEAYYYGKQGEVTKTVRTVMASVADIRTYVYGATYDSWNRVQTMTYPDGEVVTYHYNAAGQVESLTSNKQGRQSVIVDRIGYDKEGHTVYTKLGNGTETTYTYDKQRERLQVMNLTADGQTVMENRYRYDAVDNILGITNAANPTSLTKLNKAKLGGRSSHTYEYDELNRLIHANGKAKRASYDMVMSFGRMSEPLTKVQKVDSTTTAKSYNFAYKYEDSNHPTAPTQIGHDHYTYDANGNPTLVTNDSTNTTREMYWDEDNRLMVLSDNGKTSRYTYNAAGERIMKSYGTMEGVYINGAPQGITFHETDNFTLYPASILSVNKNRFTKHYFIGEKRIASRIGTGLFNNVYGRNGSYVTAGQQDYAERMNQIQKQKEAYYKQQGIAPGVPTMKGAYGDPENTKRGYNSIIDTLGNHDVPQGWIQTPRPNTTPNTNPGPPVSWNDPSNPDDPQAGYGYIPNDTTKEETFFYHSDHLGSTSYITDDHANITQYDAYLPYGELLVDEHSSSEDLPYKFNGKQFDEETGLYYYGARYMDPKISMWLGVDPLMEKYPNVTGYCYTMDNPIKFIDPNGKETYVIKNKTGTYTVVGGILNNNRGIYIASKDKSGKYTIKGEMIGISTSTTTFYNTDANKGKGGWAIGAQINPNDKSGINFLNKIVSSNVTLGDYMNNARTNHPYDFKVTNGGDKVISNTQTYIYRGVPIGKDGFGYILYSSGRDIGNMAAGIVAAKNGIPWSIARAAFDAYQTKNNMDKHGYSLDNINVEGKSTRNAEYYGWSQIYKYSNTKSKASNLWNSIKRFFSK